MLRWADPSTEADETGIATSYGLGLHSWRINAEDPNMPTNLSNTFKVCSKLSFPLVSRTALLTLSPIQHVWITMLFQGPTFTCIKLTLLLFYRRIFLVNQRWLRIAWWANMVYVMLWFVGATGFYLLQCQPVQCSKFFHNQTTPVANRERVFYEILSEVSRRAPIPYRRSMQRHHDYARCHPNHPWRP